MSLKIITFARYAARNSLTTLLKGQRNFSDGKLWRPFWRLYSSSSIKLDVSAREDYSKLSEKEIDITTEKFLSGWIAKYRLIINQLCRDFKDNPKYELEASKKMIDRDNWGSFISEFRRELILRPVEYIGDKVQFLNMAHAIDEILNLKRNIVLVDNATGEKMHQEVLQLEKFILSSVLKVAEVKLKEIIQAEAVLRATTDLRNPSEWYPHARLMKRKVFFHGGPTNSG